MFTCNFFSRFRDQQSTNRTDSNAYNKVDYYNYYTKDYNASFDYSNYYTKDYNASNR